MPKKGRGKDKLDPHELHPVLQTALEALYGHYAKTFELWKKAEIRVPPCFIVVCNNTSTSKLVYDYISGFLRDNDDGSKTPVAGRLELFRNFDEHGNPFPKPNTLLIDSEQLESGEGLDDNFRNMASDEIERFRREIVERGGKLADDLQEGKELDDVTLLREVMNTVGKYGQLGGSIRCVVLRRYADGRMGCQHCDPCAGRAGIRHAATLRAGDRPCAAAPVVPFERRRSV